MHKQVLVLKNVIGFVLLSVFCNAALVAEPADDGAIRATILDKIKHISEVWNSGDMDGYLANYRQNDDLSIYFAGGELVGSKEINELYRGTWSTVEKMGQFETSNSVIHVLSPTIVVIHGLFEHRFPGKTLQGNYSMVWQLEEGDGWKIVHEHTARKAIMEH